MITLEGSELNHCRNVMRKKIGDHVNVLDGLGGSFTAIIDIMNKKEAHLKIISQKNFPLQNTEVLPRLAVGLIKNMTRIEWMVEKAVEIGVHSINLIRCTHSERSKINVDRLHKIAVSAMKQSQRFFLPQLHYFPSLEDYLDNSTENMVCAHYRPINPQLYEIASNIDLPITALIGPEGDFSEEEISLLESKKIKLVNLGNSRLRAETAAIVALTLCNNV